MDKGYRTRNSYGNFSNGNDNRYAIKNDNDNDNEATNEIDLDEWELRILTSLKSSLKTERKISKEVKLNTSIVSELITRLMEKGLILSTRKRRLYFFSSEYFFTTLDALKMLQRYARHKRKNEDGLIEHILAIAAYWLR
jgi:DNA-binding MarR family transcriptional regulator